MSSQRSSISSSTLLEDTISTRVPTSAIGGWVVGSILSMCFIFGYFRLRTLLYIILGLSLLSAAHGIGNLSTEAHFLESTDLDLRFVPVDAPCSECMANASSRRMSARGWAMTSLVLIWEIILLKLFWDIWSLVQDSRI